MKIGLQLYSIRFLTEKDFDKALKVTADAGYEGVEFAGFFDIPKETMKEMLDKYNLVALGSHTGWELIRDDLDGVIEYNKTIGNNRIIIPGYSLATKQDVLDLVKVMKDAAPKIKENGMTLYYHNHSHEFVKVDGKYLMDLLAEEICPCTLKFEIDAYWAYRAGVNPVKYIKKHADRVGLFHAKDGNMEEGTAAGLGEVDLTGVVALGKELGIEWAVVEAESGENIDAQCADVIESAKYLKTIV